MENIILGAQNCGVEIFFSMPYSFYPKNLLKTLGVLETWKILMTFMKLSTISLILGLGCTNDPNGTCVLEGLYETFSASTPACGGKVTFLQRIPRKEMRCNRKVTNRTDDALTNCVPGSPSEGCQATVSTVNGCLYEISITKVN